MAKQNYYENLPRCNITDRCKIYEIWSRRTGRRTEEVVYSHETTDAIANQSLAKTTENAVSKKHFGCICIDYINKNRKKDFQSCVHILLENKK